MYKLYNGAPNTALKQLWDAKAKALADMKAIDPNAWCTYFPREGTYSASTWDSDGKYVNLVDSAPDKITACKKAMEVLRAHQKTT